MVAPKSIAELLQIIGSDLDANGQNYKGVIISLLYRIAHFASRRSGIFAMVLMPYVLAYKFFTEFILGVEIHWKSSIGPGMKIYHGYGLVINSDVVIGKDVTLRHGVTIGHTGRGVPTIGDRVDFGAGAIVIGPVNVGNDVVIGAGAVVTKSIPPGATWIGNPARPI